MIPVPRERKVCRNPLRLNPFREAMNFRVSISNLFTHRHTQTMCSSHWFTIWDETALCFEATLSWEMTSIVYPPQRVIARGQILLHTKAPNSAWHPVWTQHTSGGEQSLTSESLDVGFPGQGAIHIWLRPSGYRCCGYTQAQRENSINTAEQELWKAMEVFRANGTAIGSGQVNSENSYMQFIKFSI